jgi:Ca-activated chloride channel family protein
MVRILLLVLLLILNPLAFAEEPAQNEKSILVLDVSGSMWGVIDGKSKIEIAREVVSDLLKTWPSNKDLGLVAYGHREKGDCADIETVIPVGKLEQQSFDQKVRSLVPKGKTPMVASIRQAAEALKYSEDAATVILVSDGEETCEADPCAIAKELEAKGVNFTAHVIGFDLKNAGKVAEQRF